MFRNPHFERVRQVFAGQFEPEGTGFLYRKGMKGAPIRVSEDERDAFLRTFDRRLRFLFWSLIPATILLIGLLVVLVPDGDGPGAQADVLVGLGCILVPFVALLMRAFNQPARVLERRTPVGSPRTRAEIRRIAFETLTYGQLGLAGLGGAILLVKALVERDGWRGSGLLWLGSGAAVIIFAAVQAFRKWRFERG